MRKHALIVVATLAAACAQAPGDGALTDDDRAAIEALVDEWDALFAENDHEGVVALYTADYVETRPGGVRGRDEALELYSSFTITYSAVESTVERLEGEGDVAWAYLSFDADYTNAAGEPRNQRGTTLWVLRRNAAGTWEIAGSGFQATSSVPEPM